MKLKKIKNNIIKFLGGYTKREYETLDARYNGLLASKTDNKCACVSNEYLYMNLRRLVNYAKGDLYYSTSQAPQEWARRMYNVLNNNFINMLSNCLFFDSSTVYQINTSMDEDLGYSKIYSYKSEKIPSEETITMYRSVYKNLFNFFSNLSNNDCLKKEEILEIMTNIENEAKKNYLIKED